MKHAGSRTQRKSGNSNAAGAIKKAFTYALIN